MKRLVPLALCLILFVPAALGCGEEPTAAPSEPTLPLPTAVLVTATPLPPVVQTEVVVPPTEVPLPVDPTKEPEPTEAGPSGTCQPPAMAIEVNVPYAQEMHSTGESYPANCLYYCVSVPGGEDSLSFLLYDLQTDLDIYVGYGALENVQGVQQPEWYSEAFGTVDERIDLADPQEGLYYIEVCSYEGQASPFTLEVAHPGLGGVEPPSLTCEDPATSIELNTSYDLQMHSTTQGYPSNCLYYCVWVPEGESLLTVSLSDFNVDLDVYVGMNELSSVMGPSAYQWYSNAYGTVDEEVRISNPEGGLYYVEVCSYEGTASPFRLEVGTQ